MNRRSFLRRLGPPAVLLGLTSFPFTRPTLSIVASVRPASTNRIPKTCKIIGIGGAGGNLVEAIQRTAPSERFAPILHFSYIDLGTPASWRFDANGTFVCGSTSASLITLDPLAAGGNVEFARAAALKNRDALQDLLIDIDVVCLLAGLGGGTGSAVTPIMARLAREAGVLPVAVVVMPFGFEERDQEAEGALELLRRHVEIVASFSNEMCLQSDCEDATYHTTFGSIDLQVAETVQQLTRIGHELRV